MRMSIVFALVLAAGPAAAQQKSINVPADFLSPTVTEGWQLQPSFPTAEQAVQLALAWAEAPNGRFLLYSTSASELLGGAKQFDEFNPAVAARPRSSTVGQGEQ
jgi:hypothetical protein